MGKPVLMTSSGGRVSWPTDRAGASALEDDGMLRFAAPGFCVVQPEADQAHERWTLTLMAAGYRTEQWRLDLASGIFTIGTVAGALHGVKGGSCGVLDLIRVYEAAHRLGILNVLETATASPSSFCFSASVSPGSGARQQIFCVGTSGIVANRAMGRIQGVFAMR